MILGTLADACRYESLGEGFGKAFGFLRTADLVRLAAGRHEIDADRVFAIVSDGPGRGRGDGQLEVHARYADVQYVVEGVEGMGWRPAAECTRPSAPYDSGRDLAFFADEPTDWFSVGPGAFAVFFPEDAHLPLVSAGRIRKVVVKVSLDG